MMMGAWWPPRTSAMSWRGRLMQASQTVRGWLGSRMLTSCHTALGHAVDCARTAWSCCALTGETPWLLTILVNQCATCRPPDHQTPAETGEVLPGKAFERPGLGMQQSSSQGKLNHMPMCTAVTSDVASWVAESSLVLCCMTHLPHSHTLLSLGA
jgi:hypothetical protein